MSISKRAGEGKTHGFSRLIRIICTAAATGAFASLATTAQASEEHHGDVEYLFENGTIEIEFPEEDGSTLYVYESDFDELMPFDYTDDPGFDNEEFVLDPMNPRGGATPGSILAFNILGPLVFWDGDSFEDPGLANIEIQDRAPASPNILIDSATATVLADLTPGSETNVIGLADALGVVHEHVEFFLNNGELGAYGLLMSLTTDQSGISDSQRFGILFNNGLSEMDFEEGVEAFNAQVVPVPAAAWLFASALGAMGFRVRQKQA